MRFAIAGISHETNTYCRDQTTMAACHQLRGAKPLQTSTQQPAPLWPIDANVRFTL